jgi:hypothetical protein
VVPYVSLPVVIVGALWLGLLLRAGVVPSPRLRLAALGSALVVSLLVVAVAWSSIGDRFRQTPLGEALPGGRSLTDDVDRLWHPGPIDPRAPEGERLLDRYMPGQEKVVMLVTPGLGTEILIRSGRSNQLAFTDPVEDSYYGALGLDFRPALGRSIDALQPGDKLLLQQFGLKVFRTLKQGPPRDVFLDPVPAVGAIGGPAAGGTLSTAQWLLSLQEWALQRIGQRFDLQIIRRGPQGFIVARLVPAGTT